MSDGSNAEGRYIAPLLTAPNLAVLGGKGRSLASMLASGFPVPDGFHVKTSAYQEFVVSNGLQDRLSSLAKPKAKNGSLSFDDASSTIRALISRGNIPAKIQTEIAAAYEAFTDLPMAVRSSATAEDLPDLSFAGQQDTYLNVSGIPTLLEAVRKCWASLWTTRAISYRHQMAIPHEEIAMAVVVQRMVAADVSGVLFTANPATGERGEIIVNASYGLGEAIVSGQVTPDAYVVERDTLTVSEVTLGAKEQMVIANGNQGVHLANVDSARRTTESLTRDQLAHLARLAISVEAHFQGQPQDIEWLFAAGELWLLQSRPITNLPPHPLKNVRWDPPEPGAYLGRSQLVEHLPEPVSPLFEDLHMRRSLQHFWGLNLTARKRHDFEDTQPPASFVVQTTINGYAYRHLGEPPSTGRVPGRVRSRNSWLSTPLTRLRRYALMLRMYVWFVPQWRYFSLPRYLREIDRWSRLDPRSASVEQLWKGIRRMSQADARYWYRGGVWNAFALTRGFEFQLHDFLQKHSAGQFTSGQFLSGLRSIAVDSQLALWDIAELIRSDETLYARVIETPPRLLAMVLRADPDSVRVREALDDYLKLYGHQIFTLDFSEPSHGESPQQIMQSLQSLVLQEDYDPLERQHQLTTRRKTAEAKASAYFRGKLKWQFRWLLWKARHFYPNREAAMFHMGKAWTVLRPLASELGERLTAAGTLGNADDIYYLTTDELGRAIRALVAARQVRARGLSSIDPAIGEYRTLAVTRRELREARKRLTAPFHVPGPPPWGKGPSDTDREETQDGANVLKGSPVSPGKVTARASLVMSPDQFDHMLPGTILVCPTTTPAWTQLFPQAVGLVTNIGGILAHGSIVAREYGIPAVLGIVGATEKIQHGQLITVDGDRGVVTIETPETDREGGQ